MKWQVLIVDDEEQFAESLAERLTIRDYYVSVVFTGQGALDAVSQTNFDVVILDVQLPDLNGIEVLKKLKDIKPLTEVVMLSGHAQVENAIEGMKAGAFDFLVKPADSDDLFDKIEKAGERKAQQEERIRAAKVSDYVSSPRSALND
jgi:DNA-binding NtrC family response regulator